MHGNNALQFVRIPVMKKIDWNRVVIAWAIGSLIALAGSHGANAVELGVVVTAKSDKPLVHTSVSSSKIDSVKPVTTIQGVTKTYRIPVEQCSAHCH